MKRILAIWIVVAACLGQAWGQNFPTIGSVASPYNGRGLTNIMTTPGLVWQSQLTPIMASSAYVAGISASQQTLSGVVPSYVDAWITNMCTALRTNGMANVGWTNVLMEDAGTNGFMHGTLNTNGLFYRGPGGQYLINGAPGNNWVTNMLNFAHQGNSNYINVLSYIFSSKTSLTGSAGGLPASPLSTIYSDVLSNLLWGFDGIVVDFDPDVDVETERQGNRLINQAIADYQATALDASVTNRWHFTVIRAMDLNSSAIGPIMFPAEALYEVNGLSVPGIYNVGAYDWNFATNIIYFGRLCQSYPWAVGPGHWLAPTSWNHANFFGTTNKMILSMYAMCCAGLQVGRGFGEDPTLNANQAVIGNIQLFTNSAEFFGIVQDPAVVMGYQVWTNSATGCSIEARPLGSKNSLTNAILFINMDTASSHTITLTNWSIGGSNKSLYYVRDPWASVNWSNYCDQLTLTVGPTNWTLVKVWPSDFNPTKVTSCQCIGWWDFSNPQLSKGSNLFFVKDLAGGVGPLFGDQVHQGANAYGAYQTNNAGIYWGKNFAYQPGQITNGFTTSGVAYISQPDCYLFVGCTPNATSQTLMEGGGSSQRQDIFYNTATTSAMYAGSQLNTTTIIINKDYIHQLIFNGASSSWYTNGILNVSGAAGTNPQALPLYWGINLSGGQNVQADTAVLCMFRGLWSTFDQVSLEAWANSNYNVH